MSVQAFDGINQGCWIRFMDTRTRAPLEEAGQWFQVTNKKTALEWDLRNSEGNAYHFGRPSFWESLVGGEGVYIQRGSASQKQGKPISLNRLEYLMQRATLVVENRLNAQDLQKALIASTPLPPAVNALVCDYIAFPFSRGGDVSANPDVFFLDQESRTLIAEAVLYYDPTTAERARPKFHRCIFNDPYSRELLPEFNIRNSAAALDAAVENNSQQRSPEAERRSSAVRGVCLIQFSKCVATLLNKTEPKNFNAFFECVRTLLKVESAAYALKPDMPGIQSVSFCPALLTDKARSVDVRDRTLAQTLPAYIEGVAQISGHDIATVESSLYSEILTLNRQQITGLLEDYSARAAKGALPEEIPAHAALLQRILEVGSA